MNVYSVHDIFDSPRCRPTRKTSKPSGIPSPAAGSVAIMNYGRMAMPSLRVGRQRWAMENWSDLEDADTVIAFTESSDAGTTRGRGTHHAEWGMALTLFKRCIVVGHRENVFFWLPQVAFYPTWEDCLAALRKEAPHV